MMRALRWSRTDLLMAVLGGLACLLIFPLSVQSIVWMQAWYDLRNPPATASLASAAPLNTDTMRFRMFVTRHRDCEFLRLVGFTGTPKDLQVATTLRREDGTDPVSYPVGTTALSRSWILSPVYGPNFHLWGYYECDSRIVRTQLLDELLTPAQGFGQ